MEVGLVSCTKSKREDPAPPKDLYSESAYFRKARAYCEREHDRWYILSAKHLLEPDGPEIEPYGETLTNARKEERQQWAQIVREQLEDRDLLQTDVTLVIHAGKAYYGELLPILPESVAIRIPTEGLRNGETLAWFNEQLEM